MARIRTIKPEFFRHEILQEIEIDNPGCYVMLTYAALWGHCDKKGLFEWRPRQMQLDIIPFIWEATGKRLRSTLEVLVNHGFITLYTDGQKYYGHIESFTDHQRINGKESQVPALYPDINGLQQISIDEVQEKHRGSTREATETTGREGKGREQEEELSSSSSTYTEIETEYEPEEEIKMMKMGIFEFRLAYQNTFNKVMPSGLISAADQLCRQYPRETLESAFQITAEKGGGSFAYLKAVLGNHQKGGSLEAIIEAL